MSTINNLSANDYEEVRSDVAKNCKEGVTPETAISDWGDYNEDHTATKHHESFGDAETFYIDHYQPEAITLTQV